MKLIVKVASQLYWYALVCMGIIVAGRIMSGNASFHEIFGLAFYAPAIAILSVLSAQLDLLAEIKAGSTINIKARVYDLIHWLMLVAMNIGNWFYGEVTIWWFLLKLAVIAVIGWEIGLGMGRQYIPTANEKRIATAVAAVCVSLGLAAAYVRYRDPGPYGWGWLFESATAIVSTLIVIKWIWTDIATIRHSANAYPRSFFIKGILCNSLIVWFWLHVMMNSGGLSRPDAWTTNLGLSFNTIVGNLIFLGYWAVYERHRSQQALGN